MSEKIKEELEEVETPLHVESADNVAEALNKANLETTLKTIIDEKLTLNETSTDGEEEADEEEEVEEKGIGLFPVLMIGGVLAIGAFTFYTQNRPNNHPTDTETQNVG